MTTAIRAELRATISVRMWWALLVPVVLLAFLGNVLSGALTELAAEADTDVPVVFGTLALTLSMTAVLAAVYGAADAAGDVQRRTIRTTYLMVADRGLALMAKSLVNAAVGASYGVCTGAVGVLAALAGQAGAPLPDPWTLLTITVVGAAVAALWAVVGTALGTVFPNQGGAVVVAALYLLGVEQLVTILCGSGGYLLQRLPAYLPGNAADIALYDVPARAFVGEQVAESLVELLTGAVSPPPWWGALLVLAGWTAAAGACAWVVAERRDVS